MRKINKVGKELIEFHKELNKDYSDLVKKSLLESLQQMLENDIIDMSAFDLIQNRRVSKENFINALSENKRYIKSKEELFKEYEIVRKELDEDLSMSELSFLSTETSVESDEIYVCKTFTIDKDFVIEYFGVESKDISKLMSRKGFIEKFVALRLVKVLGDIIKESRQIVEKINLTNSLAYIDETGEKYNIDLVMKVKVSDLDVINHKTKVMSDIKEMEAISERIYKEKMTY